MVEKSQIEKITQQRDSANQTLSALKAKMKKLRNTHKTDFGPAIAYLEAAGNTEAASELREAQAFNDDFMRGQSWTREQVAIKLKRLQSNVGDNLEPKSGWSKPGYALRDMASRIQRSGPGAFFSSYQMVDDFMNPSEGYLAGMKHIAEQLTEIAESYKPWKVEGEPDYSFHAANEYMLGVLEEIDPVSILEAEIIPGDGQHPGMTM